MLEFFRVVIISGKNIATNLWARRILLVGILEIHVRIGGRSYIYLQCVERTSRDIGNAAA